MSAHDITQDDQRLIAAGKITPQQLMEYRAEQRKLISEQELADFCGRSLRTIRRWREAGIGPAFIKLGRKIVYRNGTVEQWIDQQESTIRVHLARQVAS